MSIPFVSFEDGDGLLDWIGLTEALVAGHTAPKADIGDTFLYRDPDTLLSRAAFIDGLGVAVKSATVFPGNPGKGKPMIHGAVTLFSDEDGMPEALLDFHLVTKWKTAADSLLGARLLARPGSRRILLVGAGTVGRNLHNAYSTAFPEAHFSVWSRTSKSAETLANACAITPVYDLEAAVRDADIVACATMTTDPIIKGAWLQPGTHVDLIGAYRPDMREVDSAALQKARVFVDSFDTTLDHIGELKIPLADGDIGRDHVLADYYLMDRFKRESAAEITLFKNGGGAHLDLMTSRYIFERWRAAQ